MHAGADTVRVNFRSTLTCVEFTAVIVVAMQHGNVAGEETIR
jgi:hypothetical protein